MNDPLVILHEDNHLIAVEKLPGLLTQGLSGREPTLEQAVRQHLGGDSHYLGTVHRLDRPVSGVVLWAKTPKAARRLATEFASRSVTKTYWGVTRLSQLANRANWGIWEDWITPEIDSTGRIAVVDSETSGAKHALTRFQLERLKGFGLLRLRPETGRTHQLRVQASSRGFPFLGDSVYGSDSPFGNAIALHAFALHCHHPLTGERLRIESSPSRYPDWQPFVRHFEEWD